jgi:hypothetical protein
MYGQDSDKRYPGMQAEFFERAGDVLKRREALRGFVALGESHVLARGWVIGVAAQMETRGQRRGWRAEAAFAASWPWVSGSRWVG